jgi:hypothetical protein
VAAAVLAIACVTGPASLSAQQPAPPAPAHRHEREPAWTWTPDANVFFGYNYQHRKFTDFSAWESQNWFMLAGARQAGAGRLIVHGMISLEPFTLDPLGSPQVFQTGETYRGTPIIDYQHPHDLLMDLGITWRLERPGGTLTLEADVVGPAALGPTPFMHRESARSNPQAPLSHHYIDATHITPGVLRVGIERRGFSLESSVFRGEEPNENRLNVDRPRLDSWSVRGGWRGGPWRLQVSGARLNEPEWFEPYDVTRLTASIEFDGEIRSRPVAATLAWGENREIHGNLDGYLLEWSARAAPRDLLHGRVELAAKDILTLGSLHPRGFTHPHQISRVFSLTLGYTREVHEARWGRVGLGADATGYRVSDDLVEPYGRPLSFHVFVRWRPTTPSTVHHLH